MILKMLTVLLKHQHIKRRQTQTESLLRNCLSLLGARLLVVRGIYIDQQITRKWKLFHFYKVENLVKVVPVTLPC